MSAREEVLARVRRAVGSDSSVATTGAGADRSHRDYRRTSEHAAGSSALLDLFVERVEDYRASLQRCGADDDSIGAAVTAALDAHAVRTAVQPSQLPPWVRHDGLVRDDGQLTALDLDDVDAVVTGCAVAIAETGTIVLDGAELSGRRAITLVPDLHICVVRAAQVVGGVPEALGRLDPLRPLTFISGPSATSDIELERVEGVHGPRTLHVILAV